VKEEEESKERNVIQRRKLMMRLKQVQCRWKKIQTKRKLLLLHVHLIRLF